MWETWTSFTTEEQTLILTLVAGVLAYGVQWLITKVPWLRIINADSSTLSKRIVAVGLALTAGAVVGEGDVVKTVLAAAASFAASQSTFLLTKSPKPKE